MSTKARLPLPFPVLPLRALTSISTAFTTASKKFGGARFNDPSKAAENRALGEKITDALRKAFEKLTG